MFINITLNVILVVYIDDITNIGPKPQIEMIIDHLKSHFKVIVKGSLKYILGIEVHETEHGVELCQLQYITNILTPFGMKNCRTVQTPIDSKAPLVKADGSERPHECTLYQQMIGSLMYLVTCTHPDLAFSVFFLSRFSSHPLKCHHIDAKRVFRYIAGTRLLSVKYHQSPASVPLELYRFSNADYASCHDNRHSVIRYIFLLNGCTISWFSKK